MLTAEQKLNKIREIFYTCQEAETCGDCSLLGFCDCDKEEAILQILNDEEDE